MWKWICACVRTLIRIPLIAKSSTFVAPHGANKKRDTSWSNASTFEGSNLMGPDVNEIPANEGDTANAFISLEDAHPPMAGDYLGGESIPRTTLLANRRRRLVLGNYWTKEPMPSNVFQATASYWPYNKEVVSKAQMQGMGCVANEWHASKVAPGGLTSPSLSQARHPTRQSQHWTKAREKIEGIALHAHNHKLPWATTRE